MHSYYFIILIFSFVYLESFDCSSLKVAILTRENSFEVGTKATLVCSSSHKSKLEWLLNNIPIQIQFKNDVRILDTDEESILTIPSVVSKFAGNLSCRGSGQNGHDVQTIAFHVKGLIVLFHFESP